MTILGRYETAGPAGDGKDRWTLLAADRALLGNKNGATRLGFAVLLKQFQADGRFPRRAEDVPMAAVEAVAAQVGVPGPRHRSGAGFTFSGMHREHGQAAAAVVRLAAVPRSGLNPSGPRLASAPQR